MTQAPNVRLHPHCRGSKPLAWQSRPPANDVAFRIVASDADATSPIFISPDVAPCDACLAELFDPTDRRYLYPFLNCTHCGPRLTIIRGAPYDRDRTTMASFVMCDACRAEYEDPTNRRFHAQPTACADCGPNLSLQASNGERIATSDPLASFVEALDQGKIGALKGLGGFHLVCHAGDERAVAELRRRKQRDEKPFAIMVSDLENGCRMQFCEISIDERSLLRNRLDVQSSCLPEAAKSRGCRNGEERPFVLESSKNRRIGLARQSVFRRDASLYAAASSPAASGGGRAPRDDERQPVG